MQARGIAPLLSHHRLHQADDFRAGRSGGAIVQVNLHGSLMIVLMIVNEEWS
jgi:hypothetical protein